MSLQEFRGSARVRSVDVLRGAVMVLMAIDHVRVYSGVPAGGPDPGVFFTRWVTHFCAPAFVFLAGTAAFLHGKKLGDARALANYLFTRGLMLVVLELTLIRFGWTFNFNYTEFTLAGVIWMLGWCMILLALLIRFRAKVVGVIGLAIIFSQQLFAFVPRIFPEAVRPTVGGLWEFIYSSGIEPLPGITILYVIVPWIGVMAAGYGFGEILLMEPARRNKICLRVGLSAIILFLVAGSIVALASPVSDGPPFIFRLLNQQKYPASQLFLLMTLGPVIALVPITEKSKIKMTEMLTVFGRVPFFYYMLHIPLIHISALVVNFVREGATHQEWYNYAPYVFVDESSRWSLPLLYLVFVVDVGLLYFACKWYVRYKFSHPESKILKYV